jgi:hypothetical protein
MENDQDNPKSSGVCERILHAFSVHPARTKIRQQDPTPASHASNPTLPLHNHVGKPVDIHIKAAAPEHPNSAEADKIPNKFDYSTPQHPANEKGKGKSAAAAPPPHLAIQNSNSTPLTKVASGLQEKPKLKKRQMAAAEVEEKHHVQNHDINNTFSDYIKRAKLKIRTVSNVGGGKNQASLQDDAHGHTKKKDSAKDHFSEYIHRAKMKLRTTSSFGHGKTISFKRE